MELIVGAEKVLVSDQMVILVVVVVVMVAVVFVVVAVVVAVVVVAVVVAVVVKVVVDLSLHQDFLLKLAYYLVDRHHRIVFLVFYF